MSVVTSIFDLQERAQKRLPKVIFDFVHGGSYEQVTLNRNLEDMRRLCIRQHDLRSVDNRNTAVRMVGDPARIPLAVGPTGLAGLTWPNGEVESAKAAAAFGVPYCLSTMSICSIEDVAEATGRPFWFQLYLMKEQKVNESLIRRAAAAGCSALVLTLDLHVQGKRRTFGNLQDEVKQARNLSALTEWIEAQFDPAFDADTVRWVRKLWPRKLILKGVMHADDARAAIDLGADAIIVSNHGGRQLDSAPSSISVLPEIAEAVSGKIEVFFDGGLRTGFDIVKAMGRGADACLSGRGCLYGLAANGRDGVACALKLFEDELNDCMILAGLTEVRKVPKGVVAASPAL